MANPKRHLSYANVVASLALFVALGGVSYAAIKLPANSVGTRELKTGAVRSADVKDRSLLAKDFRAGQLPRGATGAKGDPGTKGATGTKGDAGTNATVDGVPAGGTLSGTFPNPGLAPGAVTGAAVADNALTAADIDESTLAPGLGIGLTSGTLPTDGTVTIFDIPSVGRLELFCGEGPGGTFVRALYTSLGSNRVAYELQREDGTPQFSATQASLLNIPQPPSTGQDAGFFYRHTVFTADGSGPARSQITGVTRPDGVVGCTYVADTQVG